MIRLLEKNVADKIAAGEVVERPVSVIKELVENSLDAGASSIAVEIRKGGREYMRVSDDGCGIPRDEVSLAFRRHATSKIKEASDLDMISTLGFRGEALASIAAVSRVTMITKTADEKNGTQCIIEGSQTADISSTGSDNGTTIVIKDLFFNTPARRKFLKSDSAEANQIIEYVSQMSLCYPQVRFRMINNGSTLFTTPGRGDRLSAIYTIYGKNTAGCLLKVENSEADMHIEAYVSNTGESRSSRKGQVFFANGRVVKGKLLDNAVRQAYQERLFPGRFPIVFMFLDVDPAALDVNIHPNKREVRFDDEKRVETFISESIRNALRSEEAVPQFEHKPAEIKMPVHTQRPAPEKKKVIEVKEVPRQEQVDIKEILQINREKNKVKDVEVPYRTETVSKEFIFGELEIIGTVFSTYLIGQKNDAFYLIDQHAAHERIFYEKLLKEYTGSEKQSQTLLIPVVFDLPASADYERWISTLAGMGFTIEPFGGNTYRMTEIPVFMKITEAEKFIYDFIDSLSEDREFISSDIVEKTAAKACKAAVKGGTALHESEIKALIEDLDRCDNPYSCPHGRPTYIRFSKSQIERMFRRS